MEIYVWVVSWKIRKEMLQEEWHLGQMLLRSFRKRALNSHLGLTRWRELVTMTRMVP